MFRNRCGYFEQGVLSLHYYTRNTHTIEKKILEVTVNNAQVNGVVCDYRGYEGSLNKFLNVAKYSMKYGIKENI